MTIPVNHTTIQKDLEFLYALNGKGIKLGLSRVLELLDRVGKPHLNLKVIHVAGTNGKGTTCALLASILQAAGYRVGLYTSPHLVRFNERIRVNDVKISDTDIIDFLHKYRPLINEIDTTFFETTTVLAFEYFWRKQVDVVILETGLGGRFDATNVIMPLLSIVTPIGKDHERFLGTRLSEISLEKAGIIKPEIPCVIAKQRKDVKRILDEAITQRNSDAHYAPDYGKISVISQNIDGQLVSVKTPECDFKRLKFSLVGRHQLENLQTVLCALKILKNFDIPCSVIRKGIEAVKWHGRLEILSRKPLILYDVGHNLHGIRRIVTTLCEINPMQKYNLLITFGQRKKIRTLGALLKKIVGRIYISEIPGAKSVPVAQLKSELIKTIAPENIISNHDFESFLSEIVTGLAQHERLLILGSHYVAPVVYKYFKINV